MYKSGPVHQGVHLRGCKFGSDAYVLLPASTGAFTIVTGRHYNHHDTERMPFSYLVEEAGDGIMYDHADWLEVKITTRGEVEPPVRLGQANLPRVNIS